MAYYPKERRTILTGQALPVNGNPFTFDRFPIDGYGLTKIRLILCLTTSVGAADPITWGAYQYIKGITLYDNLDQYYFQNVPGMALYRVNSKFDKCQPYHQPILAAAGTYLAVLDLPLVFPFVYRPEDTILETKRINRLTLELSLGTIADVLVTPGANTLAVTLGIELIGTRASVGYNQQGQKDPENAKSYFHSFMRTYPMLHADVRRDWQLDAAADLFMLGFMMYNHGASGLPFIGSVAAPGNDHPTSVNFYDVGHRYLNNVQMESFQQERQEEIDFNRHGADLVSPITRLGEYWHSFVDTNGHKAGSINEGYQAKLTPTLEWTNATATDETDLVVWGGRLRREA
jgi:hypothetical protein